MRFACSLRGVSLGCLTVAAFILVGCGQKNEEAKQGKEKATETATASAADDHSGWWCDEHGVPEEVCTRCDPSVIASFKKKGDWCEKHDRPDSQCFICSPELEGKFAARYEAKIGKKPPKPEPEDGGEEE